ncbi:MAG TPA: PAS domain S-box protein, partial [Candidatus Ozemobacteraceae bacterium]|nr:PAS domain S-box protein [Candidatus Ozemobacteraceae bacterium]
MSHTIKLVVIADKTDNLVALHAIVRDALPTTTVFSATTGPTGLDLAVAEDPDVILLDIVLPGMDGFEVCRRLKADDRTKDIPVVFFSALKTDTASRVKALEAGAEGFLDTPPEPIELTALIRAMVKVKAANRSQRREKEQLEALVAERTREVRDSEQKFRFLHESAGLGIGYYTPDGVVISYNQAAARYMNGRPEDFEGRSIHDLFPEEAAQVYLGRIKKAIQSEIPQVYEDMVRLPKTSLCFLSTFARVVDSSGKVIGVQIISDDITERKRVEEALRESQAVFRALFEKSADAILLIDESRVFVECNQAALNLLKMTREAFLNKPPVMISPEFQPNGRRSDEAAQDMMDQAYEKGLHRFDWTCVDSEGGEFIVEVSLMPIVINGKTMLHTTWRDITARKQLELERQKFFQLAESSSEFIGMCDLAMIPIYVNPAGRRMVGLADMASACRVKVQDYYFPEDQAFIRENFFPRLLKEGQGSIEIRLRHFQTSQPIWMFAHYFVIRDSRDQAVGWAIVSRDITARKQAEEEQRKLQAQLAQAQKMESVGRLAGGVAHDFNNMLGVILGHAELAMESIGPNEPLRSTLEEILKAAERSADLTRQLLAFARKQTVSPRVI